MLDGVNTTKKIDISSQFFFLNFFFVRNTYKFCYEKKIAGNCCQFFFLNIFYKTLFAKKFVLNNNFMWEEFVGTI